MKPTVATLNRNARGSFLLAAALAAGWFGVNLLGPDLALGPIPLRLALILVWTAAIPYGLWQVLARSDFSPTRRVAAWLAVALVMTIWIAAAWALAVNGVFLQGFFGGKVPAIPVAIFLPVLLGSLVLTRSKAVGSLLDATPASWLVGLQVYRILGSVFLAYWIHGAMPGAFALPAGIGDVATGLLALPAAVWVASGSPIGRRIGIRWNLFGLFDFAVAIILGMLTAPGPAQLLALDHPNTQIAMFPAAMTPAFVVPFSTLLHVLSLRQLKRLQGTAAPATREPVIPANAWTTTGRVAN